MTEAVLDASGLLALLNGEPGSDGGSDHFGGGHQRRQSVRGRSQVSDHGMDEKDLRGLIDRLGLSVVAFDEAKAYAAGLLRPATRGAGLSLGDRAGLALARLLKAPAYTTDRSWKAIVGVKVHPIR